MTAPLDSSAVLDREFLEIRARLLEVAAALDRLDRAEGNLAEDARLRQIERSLAVLADHEPERAERIQMLFSRAYSPTWQKDFKLQSDRA